MYNGKKILAIIPARGGSKGLPGKNIKPLCGKPLIGWTIEAALNSKKIGRVIVSTDDEDIKCVSESFGAEVPFLRPLSLATDTSSSLDVIRYTIEKIEKDEQQNIDTVIVLQPTSPLRTTRHIDEAIILFEQKKAKAVVSYCREMHPVFWHKFIDKEGKVTSVFEGDYVKNRQEIKETYYPNGAVYIFDREYIFKTKDYSEDCYAYLMSREDSVDIDTIHDFLYAEFLLSKK